MKFPISNSDRRDFITTASAAAATERCEAEEEGAASDLAAVGHPQCDSSSELVHPVIHSKMLQYNLNVCLRITATIVAQWDFITPRRNKAEGVKSQVRSIFSFDLKSQMATSHVFLSSS